jgi:hypothetical protein
MPIGAQVTLRQGDPDNSPGNIADLFRIPFVDYARGDGISIGPGGDKNWTPALLDPVPGWADDYRGLWGFYAKDPVSGENAPAGPKFNRDGTIRRSWHNPLGWSGLQKVNRRAAWSKRCKRIADLLAARNEIAPSRRPTGTAYPALCKCAPSPMSRTSKLYRHTWAMSRRQKID